MYPMDLKRVNKNYMKLKLKARTVKVKLKKVMYPMVPKRVRKNYMKLKLKGRTVKLKTKKVMYPMDSKMTTRKVKKKLHETETERKDSETKNEGSDVPDGPEHDNKKGEKTT